MTLISEPRGAEVIGGNDLPNGESLSLEKCSLPPTTPTQMIHVCSSHRDNKYQFLQEKWMAEDEMVR